MQKIKNILLNGSDNMPILLDMFFKNDGLTKPVVIYAHGFNGFKDWGNFNVVAEKFASSGFAFIKFNFSHSGTTLKDPEAFDDLEAFGRNNYSKELKDLEIVTGWIFSQANPYINIFDSNNLYLIGHSLGGGIAILFAAENERIKKLVTWAAISECKTPWTDWPAQKIAEWSRAGVEYYLNSRTRQQLPLYYQLFEDYRLNHERLDIKKAIRTLNIPVLICHGTQDTSVPFEKALELHTSQPNAKIFSVESDHVFGRKHPWPYNELPVAMQQIVEASIGFSNDKFESKN